MQLSILGREADSTTSGALTIDISRGSLGNAVDGISLRSQHSCVDFEPITIGVFIECIDY